MHLVESKDGLVLVSALFTLVQLASASVTNALEQFSPRLLPGIPGKNYVRFPKGKPPLEQVGYNCSSDIRHAVNSSFVTEASAYFKQPSAANITVPDDPQGMDIDTCIQAYPAPGMPNNGSAVILCTFHANYTTQSPVSDGFSSAGSVYYWGNITIGPEALAAALDKLPTITNCSIEGDTPADDQVEGSISVGLGSNLGPPPAGVPQDQVQGINDLQGMWAYVGKYPTTIVPKWNRIGPPTYNLDIPSDGESTQGVLTSGPSSTEGTASNV